jgi:S-adenosylmethionine hydrolase
MKGVMHRICPQIDFIDITHQIRPHDVDYAALTLLNVYRYFEPGTIFLVVVDPGVGGTRKPIAAHAGQYDFVAPDNGVLSFVLEALGNSQIVELENLSYRLSRVSNTFHGRDIFAPAAAYLACGIPLRNMGPVIDSITKRAPPELQVGDGQIIGEVIHTDHFGNIITGIGELQWINADKLAFTPHFRKQNAPITIPAFSTSIRIKDTTIKGIRWSYSEVDKNSFVALVDSNGFLEIALNQGNAASFLNIVPGHPVFMEIT